MSDDTTIDPTPTPARLGSAADLARRMDKMEARQDNIETEVRNLATTVARVEVNQTHAEELNKLRFDALGTALGTLTDKVDRFIIRMDGIISGEIETAQGKQGREMVADYMAWRKKIDEHVDNSNLIHAQAASKQEGIVFALSGGKAVLLTIAALAGPIVALIVAFSK